MFDGRMHIYVKMKINPEACYRVLLGIIEHDSSRFDGLNRIQGLEKWTDLGICRVHWKYLYENGMITSKDFLGCKLTKKGQDYFIELMDIAEEVKHAEDI